MPELETYKGVYLWHYVPSLAASAAFAGLFGILTLANSLRMVLSRMWFCLPFVIGGICASFPSYIPSISHHPPLTLFLYFS